MTKALTLRLDDDEYEAVRWEAYNRHTSISSMVRIALTYMPRWFVKGDPAPCPVTLEASGGFIGVTTDPDAQIVLHCGLRTPHDGPHRVLLEWTSPAAVPAEPKENEHG